MSSNQMPKSNKFITEIENKKSILHVIFLVQYVMIVFESVVSVFGSMLSKIKW